MASAEPPEYYEVPDITPAQTRHHDATQVNRGDARKSRLSMAVDWTKVEIQKHRNITIVVIVVVVTIAITALLLTFLVLSKSDVGR